MRRAVFAALFFGGVVTGAAAIIAAALLRHAHRNTLPPAEPPLPDGNTRGDALLDWAAAHPDRAKAPEYLEDE